MIDKLLIHHFFFLHFFETNFLCKSLLFSAFFLQANKSPILFGKKIDQMLKLTTGSGEVCIINLAMPLNVHLILQSIKALSNRLT